MGSASDDIKGLLRYSAILGYYCVSDSQFHRQLRYFSQLLEVNWLSSHSYSGNLELSKDLRQADIRRCWRKFQRCLRLVGIELTWRGSSMA